MGAHVASCWRAVCGRIECPVDTHADTAYEFEEVGLIFDLLTFLVSLVCFYMEQVLVGFSARVTFCDQLGA